MGYSSRGCKESDTTERLHFLSFFSLKKKNKKPTANERKQKQTDLLIFSSEHSGK